MKKYFLLAVIMIFISSGLYARLEFAPGKSTLSGKITDKKSGLPFPGVTIYVPDLKTGAISNFDGTYTIENLPKTRILVQVTYIGYKMEAEYIDMEEVKTKDFTIEESVNELNEIVVTGLSKAAEINRTPAPISTISSIQLLQTSSTNIIDALSGKPGISEVTTGSGISKPVIRGLGYNRVVTVSDGIRQEGQQWGDEHGIEIDEFTINKVEILKGPASLSYGSDAIAGVINMITAPPLPDGEIQGSFLANYQTNDGLVAYSAHFAGNRKGFIWNVRYSNKKAHAYQNKYDGYVFNSGFNESTTSGIVGINKSWGYSHLNFSVYSLLPGIIEGERDSATGKFVKPVAINDSTEGTAIATEHDFMAYPPLTPYQKVHHYKAVLNNSFILGKGSLKATIGWQQNQRKEYSNILDPNQYGLYFLLNTINYDVRYIFPEKNNLSISLGANGMAQTSQNKGTEFLVPEYNLFDIGIFAIARKTLGKLDISGGLRYDLRNQHGKDLYLNASGEKTEAITLNTFHKFTAFNSTFAGVSGSVGATYQFSERVYTKINASRGFRAPSIDEVGANGVHDGTTRYEIGDPKLKAENSLQFDYSLGYTAKHFTAEADLFSNHINNFIFSRKLENVSGSDSITQGYTTFKFVSGNAQLTGGELTIDIHPHPLDWLHFENSFSYVQSIQKGLPDSTKYLPFTPPAKFTSELRADANKLGRNLANAYFKIGMDHYFEQNNFYSAYGTETATPAYTLLNVGIGADITSKSKTLFSVYLSCENLTDVAYQSHLSRLKYEAVNNVTGRTGVYNMGRNISFKLIMPIDFSKKKTG